jgi:hypothetical protein
MNAPYKPESAKLPDIYLSGEAVGHIITSLNNAIILAKTQDGTMRPFIDPTIISTIINAAVQAALNPHEKI